MGGTRTASAFVLSEHDRRLQVERTLAVVRLGALAFYSIAATFKPGDSIALTWLVGMWLGLATVAGFRVSRSDHAPTRPQQVAIFASDCAIFGAVLANNRGDPFDTVYIASGLLVLEGGLRWGVKGGLAGAAAMSVVVGIWSADVLPSDVDLGETIVLRSGHLCTLGGAVGLIVRSLQRQTVVLGHALSSARDATLAVSVDGVVLSANPASLAVLGHGPGSLSGVHLPDLLGLRRVDDASIYDTSIPGCRRVRYVHPEGDLRYLEVQTNPVPGMDAAFLVFRDVSDDVQRSQHLELQNEQLERAAGVDDLTGLPNRRRLTDAVDEALEGDDRVTLFFADLDGFKLVNDGLGHHVGDLVLEAAAQAMASVLRDGALLARWAGDEFAVVTTGISDEAACAIATRLMGAVEQLRVVAGHPVAMGCSVGVAHAEPGTSAAELFARADAAMYDVKRAHHERSRATQRT